MTDGQDTETDVGGVKGWRWWYRRRLILKEAMKVVKMVDEQEAGYSHANSNEDEDHTDKQKSTTASDNAAENGDKILKYDPDTTSTRHKKKKDGAEKEEVILPTRTRGVRAAKVKGTVIIDEDEDDDGVEDDDDKDHEVDEDNDYDEED